MRALIIIFIILAIILICVHIPVRIRIYAKYENSEFVNDYEIKYGFITVKRRKKKDKSKSEEKPKPEKKTKSSPLETIKFIKQNIKEIKRLVTDVTGYATKKTIRFEKFHLYSRIGVSNAMHTALYYGTASAFLYNTIGAMERIIRMDNIEIDFQPDFTEPKIFIESESIIRTKIYNVSGLAWLILRRAIPILKKRGENKNGKSD